MLHLKRALGCLIRALFSLCTHLSCAIDCDHDKMWLLSLLKINFTIVLSVGDRRAQIPEPWTTCPTRSPTSAMCMPWKASDGVCCCVSFWLLVGYQMLI